MGKQIIANNLLKVLYLEDTPRDAEIIRELILDSGYNLEMEIAEVKEEYETFLRTRNYDIILSDFKLPGFDAFGALQLRNEICPSIPFICISGSIGEETAIELLRLGADDYVLKDRPERLPFSIQSALDDAKERDEHLKAEELLRESEEKYRLLFDGNPHPMWVYDLDNLNFLLVNDAAIIKYGYTREEFLKMNLKDIRPVEDIDKLLDDVKKGSDEISFSGEWRHKNKKGDIFLVEIISHSIFFNQKNARLVLANDITERKRSEAKLYESEERFRSLYENSTIGLYRTTPEGKILLAN
ncbi:MAG: PAS domain S-box protein, partial [Ignavibacteria bacterium]|nr:PAS domain S-box protein [Ignavibacteria bacterium]